jgi:hypothetical protein
LAYKLTGIQPHDEGWSDAELVGSNKKATFKSNLDIYGVDGNKIVRDSVVDNCPTWDFVPSGSTIFYEVNTGKSDRVQLILQYFDMRGLTESMDYVMNNLSNQQIQKIEDGDETIIDEIIEESVERIGGWENIYITVWSDVFNTNDEGVATGSVQINPNWEKSSYMFIAHYGYDANAENQPYGEAIWNSATIALAVALIATGFGSALGVSLIGQTALLWLTVADVTAFAIDMIYISISATLSRFGVSTVNKYDERFPNQGFNHIYVFSTIDEEAVEQTSNSVSQENKQILTNFSQIKSLEDVAKFSITVLAILVGVKLIKNRRDS